MCAVSFDRNGKLYYLDPGPYEPKVGDMVLVPTDEGPEVAECVWAPEYISDPVGGLPVLAGMATPDDLERTAQDRKSRAQARVAAIRLSRELGLDMKIVAVDYVAAANRYTVFFTAAHRVDFQALGRQDPFHDRLGRLSQAALVADHGQAGHLPSRHDRLHLRLHEGRLVGSAEGSVPHPREIDRIDRDGRSHRAGESQEAEREA